MRAGTFFCSGYTVKKEKQKRRQERRKEGRAGRKAINNDGENIAFVRSLDYFPSAHRDPGARPKDV